LFCYGLSLKHRAFQPNAEPKLPISAFIITYNEEKNIRQCLQSLMFCQEIIVVDSGSTDRTRQIATELGATVFTHDFVGYKEQKQWALEQCTQPWALSLDADERVTESFYQFLKIFDFQNTQYAGYQIKRLHWFLGKWIFHSGLYPDYKLRFFRRELGQLTGANIHEVIKVQGQVLKLPYDLLHYSWPGIKEYFVTQINYAQKVAQNKFKNGQEAQLADILLRPIYTFLHRYIIRAGFLDGIAGFIVALGAAIGTAYKYLHLWELSNNAESKLFFGRAKRFKFLLKPAQFFYWIGVQMRLLAYKKGWLKSTKLAATVISVGNLSVGGSGKTPFTVWLARNLAKAGVSNIAVLTRGYLSKVANSSVQLVPQDADPKEYGDEPALMSLMLAQYGAQVVVCQKRAMSGQWAIDNLQSKVLILDDGYQHLALKRDRNICLIDCSDAYFNELLPIGSRREPLKELARADVFVLTRTEKNLIKKDKYLQYLAANFGGKPIFELQEEITKFTIGLTPLEEYLAGKKVLAFSGLGNPKQFFEALEDKGLIIKKTICFPDHYAYTQTDLNLLETQLKYCEADFLVTTAKDAIKVKDIQSLANLIVAHYGIKGLLAYKDADKMLTDPSIQASNLLGSEMFENLFPAPAEKIG
jgi:tetraacyldisaccharide 4'-kinase